MNGNSHSPHQSNELLPCQTPSVHVSRAFLDVLQSDQIDRGIKRSSSLKDISRLRKSKQIVRSKSASEIMLTNFFGQITPRMSKNSKNNNTTKNCKIHPTTTTTTTTTTLEITPHPPITQNPEIDEIQLQCVRCGILYDSNSGECSCIEEKANISTKFKHVMAPAKFTIKITPDIGIEDKKSAAVNRNMTKEEIKGTLEIEKHLKPDMEEAWGIHVDFLSHPFHWTVIKVIQGAQAKRIGIEVNDTIIAVDKTKIGENNCAQMKKKLMDGTDCWLTIKRKKGSVTEMMFHPGRLGIKFRGKKVTGVIRMSQAENFGIRVGWIIHKVNGESMADNTDLIGAAIQKTSNNKKVTSIMFAYAQQLISPREGRRRPSFSLSGIKKIVQSQTSPPESFNVKKKKKKWRLKGRQRVRAYYNKASSQFFIAALIFVNFIVACVKAQILPPKDSLAHFIFNVFEIFFGIAFTIELLINMYGNWFRSFWKSTWNWFDFTVVIISIVAMSSENFPGVSFLRLFRAFRVFRLFKRIPSLRIIIEGIFASMKGIFNAFCILGILMGVWTIIGVEFYGTVEEQYFGNFIKGMFTLWQVMTMDSWSSNIGRKLTFNHNMPLAALFFISFVVVGGILMTNVVVAVLIERYIEATRKVEYEIDFEASIMCYSTKREYQDIEKDLRKHYQYHPVKEKSQMGIFEEMTKSELVEVWEYAMISDEIERIEEKELRHVVKTLWNDYMDNKWMKNIICSKKKEDWVETMQKPSYLLDILLNSIRVDDGSSPLFERIGGNLEILDPTFTGAVTSASDMDQALNKKDPSGLYVEEPLIMQCSSHSYIERIGSNRPSMIRKVSANAIFDIKTSATTVFQPTSILKPERTSSNSFRIERKLSAPLRASKSLEADPLRYERKLSAPIMRTSNSKRALIQYNGS